MKMFKKKDGFTLVELIVVIAILAILAGVAIPAYSGYISKANDAAVVTDLDAIQTAAQGANATAGEIATIKVATPAANATTQAVTITTEGTTYISKKFVADFKLYYSQNATGTEVTTDVQTITVNVPVIGKWANSSYAKDPDGADVAGATWTRANGWKAGVTP